MLGLSKGKNKHAYEALEHNEMGTLIYDGMWCGKNASTLFGSEYTLDLIIFVDEDCKYNLSKTETVKYLFVI